MDWRLFLIWTTTIFIGYLAGLLLGSALCNRRWSEKCARCQTLMGRVHTTPGTILHTTRGRHA
jgi:hypothetical protein